MPPEQTQLAVAGPLKLPEDAQGGGLDRAGAGAGPVSESVGGDVAGPGASRRPVATPSAPEPRDVVRLFQCPLCSLPFREAVTLPCGRSVCRRCLPATHARNNITYPALRERLQGFQCPFSDCAKEHAVGDCGHDVLLNKATEIMRDEVDRGKHEAIGRGLSTHLRSRDPWQVAGISTLRDGDDGFSRVVSGGRLAATWALAEDGTLPFDTDITYSEMSTPSASQDDVRALDTDVLRRAKDLTRSEMDCQVCYALFYDPLTTGCGHTFCRSCLHRVLDHSRYCPICRRQLAINPLLNRASCPSNERIGNIIEAFRSDELVARRDSIAAEADRHPDLDTPLFNCTLAFPFMPTFLHVFEPRYRLMMRRALDGNKTFGMVLPRRPRGGDDADFHDYGTLLRIVNVQFFPDGRSLIEAIGLSRFKVLRHGSLDGYAVAKAERVDDVSLEEEETVEAAEATPNPDTSGDDNGEGQGEGESDDLDSGPPNGHQPPDSDPLPDSEARLPPTTDELEAMSTQRLMRAATGFVARMRAESVPWLAHRTLAIYGECPDDPAVFPWWFASMLPVRDLEKYRLLGTTSVRDRLKICCSWIVEWETSRW